MLVCVTYCHFLGFCGGEIKLDRNVGRLRSVDVNKDGFYEPNLNCTWTLRGYLYSDAFIHLNVTEIDIQPDDACGKDFLKVLFYHVDLPMRNMFMLLHVSV